MSALVKRTMALRVDKSASPVVVHTEQSEAGAWFRWTQRYESASHWAEIRPMISLQ